MATLYDLAMQYLNQSLPKTFKYDRTPPIGINPPTQPGGPPEPIAKILPRPGGNEEGFSVYNPDPNRTRNESNYNPRTYNKVMRDTDKFGETVMPNPDLYYQRPLEGIPGMVQGYMKNSIPGQLIGKAVSGIESLLPVNQRAIYENELLGQGIALDDIGRIVSDGGNINTAENIMAGYNANKVTAETFQKRRDMINANMKDPAQKAAKLAALDAAEEKMLGTAKTRADTIFDAKSLEKDPSYVPFDTQLDINNIINQEKEEDENFDPLDPTSIYKTKAPTYLNNYPTTITGSGDGTGSGGSYDEAGIDYGDGTGPGGSYDEAGVNTGGGYNAGSGYNATGKGGPAGQGSPKYGTGSGNLGDYQIQPSKPETKKDYGPYSGGGGNDSGNNSGKSIVCTAMYQTTGLEDWSKAMKIWYIYQKKYLTIQHQEGYHKLFKPFVKGMHKNKIIRAIGAHIAKHRTQDLKHIMFGSKPSWLGRVYRKILEPICYFVGKHG